MRTAIHLGLLACHSLVAAAPAVPTTRPPSRPLPRPRPSPPPTPTPSARDPADAGAARRGRRRRRRRRRHRPRRAPRDAGPAALRSRHHQGRQVRCRRLHRAPDPRPRLLRDPQGHARTRVPLGQPDRVDDGRRRVRRPGRRQPRRPLGAPRPPHPAAQRLLRDRRRPGAADRPRRPRRQLRHHPDGVPDRDARQERRAGHRGVAAVHDRGARVQRAGPAARPRLRLRAGPSSSASRPSPPTSKCGPSTPSRRRTSRPAPAARPGAGAARRAGGAARQLQRADVLQHGAAAREADAAAAPRRARRLLLADAARFRRRRAPRARAPLHHALAAREEGSGGGGLGAGQADRLLHRSGDAGEVGAVREGAASKRGRARSRRPASARRSSPRTRRRRPRIPSGAPRTRATR